MCTRYEFRELFWVRDYFKRLTCNCAWPRFVVLRGREDLVRTELSEKRWLETPESTRTHVICENLWESINKYQVRTSKKIRESIKTESTLTHVTWTLRLQSASQKETNANKYKSQRDQELQVKTTHIHGENLQMYANRRLITNYMHFHTNTFKYIKPRAPPREMRT